MPVKIHVLEPFRKSCDAACKKYKADHDVLGALLYLKWNLTDPVRWLNDSHPLEDILENTVEAACRSENSFKSFFVDREGEEGPDQETAAFLKGICGSRALSGMPSTSGVDPDSRLYIWQPVERMYRDHVRALGVYLHYPEHERVLLHFWIGHSYYLERALAKFQSVDFNWINLWEPYGNWLAQRR